MAVKPEKPFDFTNLFLGAATAIAVWGIFILGDLFDEKVLDTGTEVGAGILFFLPVVMFVLYIIHCVREKPEKKALFSWHSGYLLCFNTLWYWIGGAVNQNRFFIKQDIRSSVFDFNGLEYLMYGVFACVLFLLLCIMFHAVWFVVRKIRKNA